ncbi:MAG: hypothetical protein FWG63_02230 [Defluviitaleaceae bacterium]|nr:hypothetical protein [Defluviitaleaceae bacterium]
MLKNLTDFFKTTGNERQPERLFTNFLFLFIFATIFFSKKIDLPYASLAVSTFLYENASILNILLSIWVVILSLTPFFFFAEYILNEFHTKFFVAVYSRLFFFRETVYGSLFHTHFAIATVIFVTYTTLDITSPIALSETFNFVSLVMLSVSLFFGFHQSRLGQVITLIMQYRHEEGREIELIFLKYIKLRFKTDCHVATVKAIFFLTTITLMVAAIVITYEINNIGYYPQY